MKDLLDMVAEDELDIRIIATLPAASARTYSDRPPSLEGLQQAACLLHQCLENTTIHSAPTDLRFNSHPTIL
ncbi:hypothetical protein N3K66_004412 [Trichothecium roseum]|uniref:Uncharacterized protein n=1 Tax=Trichothecium roseum TaxID=47278 RepID=A0ACC0V172_9HYPO|nr:hypothetical protein N3K66_004412 [Trichothecium roseum]